MWQIESTNQHHRKLNTNMKSISDHHHHHPPHPHPYPIAGMGTNGNWRKLDITHLEPHCYPNDLTHTKVGMEITHRSLGEHPKSHGFSLSFPEKKSYFMGTAHFWTLPNISNIIFLVYSHYIYFHYIKKKSPWSGLYMIIYSKLCIYI